MDEMHVQEEKVNLNADKRLLLNADAFPLDPGECVGNNQHHMHPSCLCPNRTTTNHINYRLAQCPLHPGGIITIKNICWSI
jgi:hypothetical protein